MALYHFHRVLVAASILFDVAFSVWCWRMYRISNESVYIVLLIGSSFISIGFIAYLVRFNRKTRALRFAAAGRCVACGADVKQAVEGGEASCPRCGAELSDDFRRIAHANLRPGTGV